MLRHLVDGKEVFRLITGYRKEELQSTSGTRSSSLEDRGFDGSASPHRIP